MTAEFFNSLPKILGSAYAMIIIYILGGLRSDIKELSKKVDKHITNYDIH